MSYPADPPRPEEIILVMRERFVDGLDELASTSPPAISARSSAARTARAPSSVAGMSLNCPPKLPTGVRTALTITASSITASSVKLDFAA
jgi:hypothetical protein